MGLSTRDFGSESDANRGSGATVRVIECVSSSPAVQCAYSLHAVWSSRNTTMNPDQGSESSESGFSARVESPIDVITHIQFSSSLFH